MTPLLTFLTCDYAGLARGRSVLAADAVPGRARSVGWVPANMSLTPFDEIASPNPWGSVGDLRLLGDETARFRLEPRGAATPMELILSDIVELDGSPWPLCPRGMLKAALADLEHVAGVTLLASFEHEFRLFGTGWDAAPAFSLRAMRQADPFGPALMAVLEEAGLAPEMFLAEYGRDQFEVTLAPSGGLAAADSAVVLRETVREMAALRGWRASFAPKTEVAGVGNGVHVHLSLRNSAGRPASYDAARAGGVSALMGAFLAGIMRHMPALVAVTAPCPISYLRLQPHHWSSSYTWFGAQDREASLRICPVNGIGGREPAAGFNVEYRPADATACPHLVLAMLVRAGIEGIRAGLDAPPLFSGDPETLSAPERDRLGLHRLPGSLEEALAALEADEVARGWFDPKGLATYTGMKRAELELAGAALDDALCARYAAIY